MKSPRAAVIPTLTQGGVSAEAPLSYLTRRPTASPHQRLTTTSSFASNYSREPMGFRSARSCRWTDQLSNGCWRWQITTTRWPPNFLIRMGLQLKRSRPPHATYEGPRSESTTRNKGARRDDVSDAVGADIRRMELGRQRLVSHNRPFGAVDVISEADRQATTQA
jgi:hypothetical protein